MLAWLVCAQRPLKWQEIQCAAAIDPDNDEINPNKRFVSEPKEICGSLIERQPDGTLQLVHTTAKL